MPERLYHGLNTRPLDELEGIGHFHYGGELGSARLTLCALTLAVGAIEGKVLLTVGVGSASSSLPLQEVALSPDDAEEVARRLSAMAAHLRGTTGSRRRE